jgi:hypothetical protein
VPLAGHDSATLLGKHYVDAPSGLEALCTKGGTGALAFAGRLIAPSAPKLLPSSD